MRYNRFRERLPDSQLPEPASPDYLDFTGKPKWSGDPEGFDASVPPKLIILPKGYRILRYGPEAGYHAAPLHTPYAELAMPYRIRSCEYNEYEVVADGIMVEEIPVIKGRIALQPYWPEERGGGIQYLFPNKDERKTVLYYVGRGLRRLGVSEWSSVIEEDRHHR